MRKGVKTKNESEGLSYGFYCKGLSSGLERGPYKEGYLKVFHRGRDSGTHMKCELIKNQYPTQ